jgi:glucose-1-phosphate cytidylyltransferase
MSNESMKTIILAGGLGTRILEESATRPKPMVEIGGRPILWHIMKLYAAHGLTDFIICLGYKGYIIKEYFANYFLHHSDITIDASRNEVAYHGTTAEPWRITLIDTGEKTLTGGRLRRVAHLLDDGPFCFTYGDGLADIEIPKLVAFHREHGRLATVSAVVPPGRYGALDLDGDRVKRFVEKPPGDQGYINGGFFVLEPRAVEAVTTDDTSWEAESLPLLAAQDQLRAFRHPGFWHAMDTLRDRNHLEHLWSSGAAPWRVWR